MAMKRGRFEEIYRQETQSGKSTLGALASTAAERRREMTDLRRMFPSSGILGAMLESAFGKAYKYKAPGKGAMSEKGKGSDSFDAKTMNVIRVNTAITAKNSMVLPGMARDMNVMRQNIVKLTKHTTGAASTRADAFFLKSKERENAYEAQLADKTPQQVKDAGTKKEQKGFFSNLLSSILSLSFKDLLIGLLKGGLIAGVLVGIGKYFKDPEFKKSVNDMINNLGSAIFGAEYWENLKKDIKSNLVEGALLVGGSYLAFKGAVALFTSALTGATGTLSTVLAKFLKHPAVIAIMAVGAVGTVALKANEKAVQDINKKSKKFAEEGDLAKLKLSVAESYEDENFDKILGYNPIDKKLDKMERDEVRRRLEEAVASGSKKAQTALNRLDASYGIGPKLNKEQMEVQKKIDALIKEREDLKSTRPSDREVQKFLLNQEISKLQKQKEDLRGASPTIERSSSQNKTSPSKVVSSTAMPESYANSEMAELIRKKFIEAGFTSDQAEAAVVNAYAESRLNPKARAQTNKEDSVGLFQANRKGGLGTGYSVEQLQDPEFNIDLAIQQAKKSKSFGKAGSVSEAIAAFVRDVERPANMDEKISKRIAMINQPLETVIADNTEINRKLYEQKQEEKESTMTEILTALLQGMASATTGATVNNVNNTTVASGPVASPYNEDMMNIFKQRVTQGF